MRIYPTARAIFLMVLGAPLALAAALVSARLWLVGPAWIALVAACCSSTSCWPPVVAGCS